MNNREKLRQWFERRKGEGLVDLKFFQGEKRDMPLDDAAREVLAIVTEECESVDVTETID